ncbi:MAG: signal peptidase II, partial [Anaerolineales bacterium]
VFIAWIVIYLDQVVKIVVRAQLGLGESWTPWPEFFIEVVHWKNTGMVFGVFEGYGVLIAALGLLVTILILVFFPNISKGSRLGQLGIGLMLGGTVGNLVDRITIGYVTDVLYITGLPVFNLADVCLYLGVVLVSISILREEISRKQEADAW